MVGDETGTGRVSQGPLGITALAAIAALAALAAFTFLPSGSFEEGSAEAAVSGFLRDGLNHDRSGLVDRLVPELRDGCASTVDLNDRPDLSAWAFELDELQTLGDSATAQLLLQHDDATASHTVELRRSDDEWLVSDTSWPEHLVGCIAGDN